MSPRSGKARRTRSASPDYDEDPELWEAIQRSKDLSNNGGPSDGDEFDQDADFKLALQLQLAEESDAHAFQEDAFPLRNTIGFMDDPARRTGSQWNLDENKKGFSRYHAEADHNTDISTLASFLSHVTSAQCPKCGSRFFRSEHDARKLLLDWKNGSSPLTSSLTCTYCFAATCLTCMSQAPSEWSRVSASGKEITWCCAGGRLLLLWLLLCGVDEHFSTVKTEELSRQNMKPRSGPGKNTKSSRGRGGGIGFGGSNRPNMPGGMGYGGYEFDPDEDHDTPWSGVGHTLSGNQFDPTVTSGKAKALSAQHAEDQFYGLHMHLIEGLLPSFERESSFDFEPPDCITEMLMESKILAHCAELLRNDSLEDATQRKLVYQPLFSLLRTLGAHYVSASSAIFNERPIRQERVNLVTLSFYKHPGVCTERASSLLNVLGNLNIQSEMVLRVAKRNENDFLNVKGEEMLLLCRQIADLYRYLMANSGIIGKAKPDEKGKAEVPALIDVPDRDIFAVHHFSQAAKKLRTYTPGRSRRLVTELTTLKTGLPPGIFVRYADSRPDVQKVVIIGPTSTPYENGIFEFDVFCGGEFPNKPPQVQFKTTGGWRVNFNPNLYADGKVCLSLLGTWSGEPWIPGESTLLQVYLSIQSMILCEEPWYNEPGREAGYQNKSGDSPSARFNQQIREHTVRTAMLDWLDKKPSLWKDVLDQHFTTNADKILHAAIEWSKSNIQIPTRSYPAFEYDDSNDGFDSPVSASRSPLAPIEDMLPLLQKALKKYGASQVVAEKSPAVVSKGKKPSSSGITAEQASDRPTLISQLAMGLPHHSSPSDFSLHPPPSPGGSGLPGFSDVFSYFSSSRGRGGHRGRGIFNVFAGPGRALGEASPGPATQTSSVSGHVGSLPNISYDSRGTGRYETRSSTRREAYGSASGPSQGSNTGEHSPQQPSGRGDYHLAHGRGGLGDHGGRGGYGSRGGYGGYGGGGQSGTPQ